jgi:flagellar assembly protein FliH
MTSQHLIAPESDVRPHVLEPFLVFTEEDEVEESRSERVLHEMYERGRAEGRKEAEAALRTAAEALTSALHTLNSEIRAARDEMERDVVKLSVAIARKVVMHEIATRPETIKKIVHALIEEAEDRNVSAIRLSASDQALLQESGAVATLEEAGIAVHTSDEIRPGGCVIETAFGRLDARIETRLDEIATSLLGKESPRASEPVESDNAQ